MHGNYNKIVNIILTEAKEINEGREGKIPVEAGENTPLFGGDKGVLTSIALVTLIVAVEQAVEGLRNCLAQKLGVIIIGENIHSHGISGHYPLAIGKIVDDIFIIKVTTDFFNADKWPGPQTEI